MSRNGSNTEDLLNNWLTRLGYRVAFRVDGWVDCLIWRGDERWLGRGSTRMEAFEDAFGQMLPSHAARTLLSGFLEASLRAPEPVAEPPVPEATPEPPPASAEPAEPEPEPEPEPPAPEVPEPVVILVPGEAPVQVPSPDLFAPVEEKAAEPAAPPPSAEVEEPAFELPPPMDPEEALSEVGILSELIESKRPELALMTPERQRLEILAWICHARSLQAASGGHSRVVGKVTSIARKLTLFSKLWWPGSVMALQIDATPHDVGRELDLPRGTRPNSWGSAAEAPESKLREVEERAEANGRDEYGWADGAFLDPPPINPAGHLLEVQRLIEQVAGGVEQKPPQRAPESIRKPSPERKKQMLDWAMRVRWLRGFVADFLTWGHVMGRLRWMAAQAEHRDDTLMAVLDPVYKPRHSWASELGQDPDAKRKRRLRKEVLQRRDRLRRDRADRDAVVTWLNDAFGVLESQRIANLLAPFHATIMNLDPDDLPESNRSTRRRLRAVQKHLSTISGGEVVEELILDEVDLDEGVEDTDPGIDEDESATDPAEELLFQVRGTTEGLKALFVSNRSDPELESTLRDAFGFSSLDWCEGSPRRIQTVAERVAAGTYDLVLGATGFQSHSMDTHLLRACRRADVRYVRVHRGRLLACTLALARELGISSDGVAGSAL